MNSKKIGLVILIIGLILTLYTGYNYVTQENVIVMGNIHMTMAENHSTNWSPFIGLGVMVIGLVLFLYGKKNSV